MKLRYKILSAVICALINPFTMLYAYFYLMYSGVPGSPENWYFVPNILLLTLAAFWLGFTGAAIFSVLMDEL